MRHSFIFIRCSIIYYSPYSIECNLSSFSRISVRYCDFHLHEDVKVKLPDSVKDRITEMLQKKLPMPVIVEVIKGK